MKIYFAASIRAGQEHRELYAEIIKYLSEFGQVLTEHIKNENITAFGEIERPSKDIHDEDLAWLKESNIVIAELSTPSLGVGYELAYAKIWKKPVLCLYKNQEGKRLSAMIDGCMHFEIVNYDTFEEIQEAIHHFIKKNTLS